MNRCRINTIATWNILPAVFDLPFLLTVEPVIPSIVVFFNNETDVTSRSYDGQAKLAKNVPGN